MDADRFDTLARVLATSSSRRALGTALSAVVGVLTPEWIASAERKKAKSDKKRKTSNNHSQGIRVSGKRKGKKKGNTKKKKNKTKVPNPQPTPPDSPLPTSGCADSRPRCGAMCCSPDTDCIADQGICIPRNLNACIATGGACENELQCNLATGESCCAQRCTNSICDATNCGRCGRNCPSNQRCFFGVCYTPGGTCPPATTPCGNTCCGVNQQCHNGSCSYPPGLNLVLTTVCEGARTFKCSLQWVLEPTDIRHCVVAVGSQLLKSLLKALRLPELVDAIEAIDLGSSAIDVNAANTNLKVIAKELLDVVLPVDCIAAIADLLSSGQYQQLQLCLADEPCTRELYKTLLGIDDPCFARDCAELSDDCNDGICLNSTCATISKPDETVCGNNGQICVDGTCRTSEPYELVTRWQIDFTEDGVAADRAGNVYASGAKGPWHGVAKYRSDGTLLSQWSIGSVQYLPGCLTVDGAGNIYILIDEVYERRVHKYTADGTLLTKWGETGGHNGQFRGSWDVATDEAGHVYVADSGNHRIQKFTTNGTFLMAWGTQGGGDGEFDNAVAIAVSRTGTVYVADHAKHRIQKFSTDGAYLGQWGTFGAGLGQFNRPTSMAVDHAGNLYVSEISGRIQKFTADGTYLAHWWVVNNPNWRWMFLDVDGDGNVYTLSHTEDLGHAVQKYATAPQQRSAQPDRVQRSELRSSDDHPNRSRRGRGRMR